MQTNAPSVSVTSAADSTPPTPARVAAHIRAAAQATGVPFEFLLAQANTESRLNPEARSPRSSAQGLFQFTSGTWMEMVKKHGAEHGLERYVDSITRGRDGRYSIKDPDLRKEVLELRRDSTLSALMAGEYAKDNQKVMEAKLGRKVQTQDLYLAHFLGAGGAVKLLQSLDQAQTAPELADAAHANPDVFKDEAGEERSHASVYDAIASRFKAAMAAVAPIAKKVRPPVDLASLKPEPKPDELNIQQDPIPLTALAALQPDPATALLTSHFPAKLPPRPGTVDYVDPVEHPLFPVPLPPPVAGARADGPTLRGLIQEMEKKA